MISLVIRPSSPDPLIRSYPIHLALPPPPSLLSVVFGRPCLFISRYRSRSPGICSQQESPAGTFADLRIPIRAYKVRRNTPVVDLSYPSCNSLALPFCCRCDCPSSFRAHVTGPPDIPPSRCVPYLLKQSHPSCMRSAAVPMSEASWPNLRATRIMPPHLRHADDPR